MRNSKTQLDTLTGLRAFAAIWVMLFHYAKNAGIYGVLDLGPIIREGRWGVEIFFVLSGFVLTHVYTRNFISTFGYGVFFRYLFLRLARIYPLHAATLLALVAMVYTGSQLGTKPNHPEFFLPQDVGWSLALLHAWGFAHPLNWNYVSWSISAEWFAYLLLFPLFSLGFRWIGVSWLLALSFAGWLLFFFTSGTTAEGFYLNPFNSPLSRITVDFFAGYALYRLWSQVQLSGWRADLLVLLGTAGLLLLCFTDGATRLALLPCIVALIYGLACQGPISYSLFANRPVVFLGEISYAIYLVHPLVEFVSDVLVRQLSPFPSPFSAITILLIDVTMVLMLSTLAYAWIEKPFRDQARAFLERKYPLIRNRSKLP